MTRRLALDALFAFILSRALFFGLVIAGSQIEFMHKTFDNSVWETRIVFNPGRVRPEIERVAMVGDAWAYRTIAEKGYDRSERSAFFPLFPFLTRCMGSDFALSGLVLSNIAFAVALLLLGAIAARVGEDAGPAMFYLAFFPTSYFLSLPVTEALFLALVLAATLFGLQGRWLAAGVAGGLATATRLAGILLVPLLLIIFLQRNDRPRARLAWLALVPCGLLAFMAHLYRVAGDPFAFIRAQASFDRTFSWRALGAQLHTFSQPWNLVVLNAAAALLVMVAGLHLLVRREWAFAVHARLGAAAAEQRLVSVDGAVRGGRLPAVLLARGARTAAGVGPRDPRHQHHPVRMADGAADAARGHRAGMKRDLSAAAFFIALAIAMTWPLARIITRAVAYPGDPYHLIWTLDWDWFATFHRPFQLFQANIFYPAKDTLAYSEHLYGIAIFLFPLRMIGLSALVAHNVGVILAFAFSGFAAYVLGRTITGKAMAGVAAGVFYAYLPWRFTHLPHISYLWLGWQPLLIVALIHCARKSGWKSATLFGAAFLLNGLTNLHYFVFGSTVIALSVPLLVRDRKQWLRIGAAVLVATALIVPFLIPYFRVARQTGMGRSWSEVKSWSATPRDWLNPGATNRAYRRVFDPKPDPELWLFPGAVGIAMSCIGVVAARRERRTLALALLWLVVGFVGSLGVHAFFHRFLYGHVPGFRSLRVPARWANIAYLGMTMLIAFGAAWRKWIAVLAAAVFIIELHAAPIRWHCTSPSIPPVYRWLKSQRGPIAELPMDIESEYRYLRYSTEHHLPMVNGISSFVPPRFFELADKWADPAGRDALLDDLRAIGVRLVIVHGDTGWLREGRLQLVRRFDDDSIFRFDGAETTLTVSRSTTGALEEPRPNAYFRYKARFAGWATSPFGVRAVNLLFDNGGVRVPAALAGSRFVAQFAQRPPDIRRDTDVQVEIVDGRGERTLLEGQWLWWGP